MQHELVSVPEFWTVGDIVDYQKNATVNEKLTLLDYFYSICVVDLKQNPTGAISLDTLLKSKHPIMLSQIMQSNLKNTSQCGPRRCGFFVSPA